MLLADLSLPVLALILLGVVLYNVRVEKRRSRAAGHTVGEVNMRDVRLNERAEDLYDDGLFDPAPAQPREISRH